MHPQNASVQYEHIRIEGPPFERGRQYGQKAAEKIRQNIAHYYEPGMLPPWADVERYIETMYIPGLEKHFPAGLEEMKGIAAGAGVSLKEIVMLNARYDLSRAPGGSRHVECASKPYRGEKVQPPTTNCQQNGSGPTPQALPYDTANECTSSVFLPGATSDGGVLASQNWDISAFLYNEDLAILLEIHPDPSEGIPSMFVLTEPGQLGRSGMNSAGLGVLANALNSSADYVPSLDDPNPKPCVPISLVRRMFLHHKSYPKAIQAVYSAPRHVSGNLVLSTAEGFSMCMEMTPNDVFLLEPQANQPYLIHSNHFLHPAVKARCTSDLRDTYPGGSSWYRHVRFFAGIKDYLDGGVDAKTLIRAYSDHLGYPQALCQHQDKSVTPSYMSGMTIACVVYDLTRKVITTCKGPPCMGVFESYRLDD